ncbi:MAG: hypothetical protein IPQ16_01080 [Geobacteraceae bacterium]|nr:hypothetical protein [Geobacteraceae bacterium]
MKQKLHWHGSHVQPRVRINLQIKDLANVLDTSHELGVPLPLTAADMADGLGDANHYRLVQ